MGTIDNIRELDILAEKETRVSGLNGLTCRLRVLVSCRGFPTNHAPLAYSVSEICVPSFGPRLVSGHRVAAAAGAQFVAGGQFYGALPDLERRGAVQLLKFAGLDASRPLVAYTVLTNPNERKSDRGIFEAIDSATKAAFYWKHMDNQSGSEFVAINVAVCVFDRLFWDVCIDGGKASTAERRAMRRSGLLAGDIASSTIVRAASAKTGEKRLLIESNSASVAESLWLSSEDIKNVIGIMA